MAARRARRDGRELALTVREFDLLAFFMAHPGQAFTRAELMERVWGWTFGDQSTVTVHVRRLRDKVEEEPASPVLLRTVRGIGYCWDAGALAGGRRRRHLQPVRLAAPRRHRGHQDPRPRAGRNSSARTKTLVSTVKPDRDDRVVRVLARPARTLQNSDNKLYKG